MEQQQEEKVREEGDTWRRRDTEEDLSTRYRRHMIPSSLSGEGMMGVASKDKRAFHTRAYTPFVIDDPCQPFAIDVSIAVVACCSPMPASCL